MTKILYVIGTLDVGGTERQLVELVTRLDRTRFEPVVCCLSAGGPLEGPLRQAGIRVHVAGFRGFLRLGTAGFVRNLPHLAKELGRFLLVFRRERPDIVHGFLFWAYVLGAYAARLNGVPVVVTSRRGLSHFKSGRPAFLRMERIANRYTDLVVANSEAVRDDTVHVEGLDPRKVAVVYNGVNSRRFEAVPAPDVRLRLGLDPGAPVVVVLANLIPYKGHRYLIEAWSKVHAWRPEAVCLLIGEGPARQDLQALSARLHLAGSVRFLGTRDDVADLITMSNLVVHPSLEEGFCNAILEAMAAGKAVVATRVGGNAEAVVDGETGILVAPADAESLAGAVIDLISDSNKSARMGAAGRQRAALSFGLDAMVRRYEEVYETLLSNARRPPASAPGAGGGGAATRAASRRHRPGAPSSRP